MAAFVQPSRSWPRSQSPNTETPRTDRPPRTEQADPHPVVADEPRWRTTKYSAGRLWVVLPALLPRFGDGAGVGSGAWVPAWPPIRLTPLGLSCETICRPVPGFLAPAGAAGLICLAWARGRGSQGPTASGC